MRHRQHAAIGTLAAERGARSPCTAIGRSHNGTSTASNLRSADAPASDGSADWVAELTARNRRLLAQAAQIRQETRAAIGRANAAVLNVMHTRTRLELTRWPPPDLP